MDNQAYPKVTAFRSLVEKAATIHAEIVSAETAVANLEAIRARIGECHDEADCRQYINDLKQAEEAVLIKRIREPRLLADLAVVLTEADEAIHDAKSEMRRHIESSVTGGASAIRGLLASIQSDGDVRRLQQLNESLVQSIRPNVLAQRQDDRLRQASCSVVHHENAPETRIRGLIEALFCLDAVARDLETVANEDKRMVAACEAFRKAYKSE